MYVYAYVIFSSICMSSLMFCIRLPMCDCEATFVPFCVLWPCAMGGRLMLDGRCMIHAA